MKNTFSRRFSELHDAFGRIHFRAHGHGMSGTYVPDGEWQGWGTSVQNLLHAVFGENGQHYRNYIKAYSACRGGGGEVRTLQAIFESAKQDFEGGYVFSVDLRVSGEVFGDLVSLARQSLSEGHKDVAAVLACAALEDSLKRYAIANDLDVAGKTMAEVVNALKGGGLVSGAQKSLLDAMPRIRNMAMHAEWSKISELEVSSVLGYVEQLLLTKFSGA